MIIVYDLAPRNSRLTGKVVRAGGLSIYVKTRSSYLVRPITKVLRRQKIYDDFGYGQFVLTWPLVHVDGLELDLFSDLND